MCVWTALEDFFFSPTCSWKTMEKLFNNFVHPWSHRLRSSNPMKSSVMRLGWRPVALNDGWPGWAVEDLYSGNSLEVHIDYSICGFNFCWSRILERNSIVNGQLDWLRNVNWLWQKKGVGGPNRMHSGHHSYVLWLSLDRWIYLMGVCS